MDNGFFAQCKKSFFQQLFDNILGGYWTSGIQQDYTGLLITWLRNQQPMIGSSVRFISVGTFWFSCYFKEFMYTLVMIVHVTVGNVIMYVESLNVYMQNVHEPVGTDILLCTVKWTFCPGLFVQGKKQKNDTVVYLIVWNLFYWIIKSLKYISSSSSFSQHLVLLLHLSYTRNIHVHGNNYLQVISRHKCSLDEMFEDMY